MLTHRRPTVLILLLIAMLMLSFSSFAAGETVYIAGNLFIDRNFDGLMDDDDASISGIKLSLIQGEQEIQTLRTNEDGSYSFDNVPTGEYHIDIRLPDDFIPTRYQKGGSELIPSSGPLSRTAPFTVSAGTSYNINLGAINAKSGSFIRFIAFGDDNLNGGRFSSEPLLRGVQVELLTNIDDQFYVVESGETDKEGSLTLPRVAPGEYLVGATMFGDYIIGPLGTKISTFYNTILPSESHYGRSAPFNLPEKGSLGMGIGGALTGSAEGMVWDDLNFDAIKNSGEPGLAGIELKLKHQSMGVERVMLSQPDGSFVFPTLQPGEYTLTATLPDHLMFTAPGGDSIFSADDSRSQSKTVTAIAEKKTDFGRIGVIPNTALKVQTFHDSNVSGLLDAGEPVFAGAELKVLKNDRVIASAVSDSQGIARIPLLRAGDYELQLSLPDGQIFSIDGGENGNRFFTQTAASLAIISYTVAPGQTSELLAGTTLPGIIAGSLFNDRNNNAVYDSGEEFQANFAVQAIDSKGEIAAETLTDGEGNYQLPELIPGSYKVRIILQSPFIFSGIATADAEMSNRFTSQTAQYGQTDDISLQPGQMVNHVDGAIFRSAVIEGDILLGDEADQFAGALGGLEGVLIELLDEDAKPVSEYTVASTDADGHYLLKGALPGSYSLQYTLPAGSAFSQPLSDEAVFTSSQFDVNASDELLAKTLFAVKTGTYSGILYIDNNINGIFDAKDQPLSGITLRLESETAANSRQVQSLEDGSYIIEDIRPGSYQLLLDLPAGFLFSFDESSPFDPAISSSSNAAVEMGMGMHIADRMIAALPAHELAGRVYYDNNLDRKADEDEPGYVGLELRFRHVLSRVEFKTVTDAQGKYSVPILFPGDYTVLAALPEDYELYAPGGAVSNAGTWESKMSLKPDVSSSNFDLGLVQFGTIAGQVWNLDGSDQAVSGLTLRLLKATGNEVVSQAETGADGSYQFSGLYPGDYLLSLTLSDDYRFVRSIDSEMARFSQITSDGSSITGNSGISSPFTLLMSENKLDQGVGICTLAQIGDFAWLDLDHDGMQDAGEPGVPGIVIRLFQYGQEVASAQTDEYGRYRLTDLYPGEYSVQVAMPKELKATKQQTEFHLVASFLPEVEGEVIIVEDIIIQSGSRNLNFDMGFVTVKEGVLPPSMLNPPQKDWTPYVQVEPKRVR